VHPSRLRFRSATAAAQFVAHGYGATVLDHVAEQAGVAVQTVYFHFGNKRTLLKEALDIAAVGDDEPVPLLERPWMKQIQQETDPVRIIELWLDRRVRLDGRRVAAPHRRTPHRRPARRITDAPVTQFRPVTGVSSSARPAASPRAWRGGRGPGRRPASRAWCR
jgi:AcrR family transcriptional regulator